MYDFENTFGELINKKNNNRDAENVAMKEYINY